MESYPETRDTEEGNKIFLIIVLILSVLIVVLLLLLALGILPIGGAGACECNCGDLGMPPGLCQTPDCTGDACKYVTVEGCCGNGACEADAGETPGNCPIDCMSGIKVVLNGTYLEYEGGELSCPDCVCRDGTSGTPGEPGTNGNGNPGALCICYETDCADKIDNDGDGYIDCDDPDCPCPEGGDCPECPPCDEGSCQDECYPPNEPCKLASGAADGMCIEGVDGCYSCVPETGDEPECQNECICAEDCVMNDGSTGMCTKANDGCCYCRGKELVACESSETPTCGGYCTTDHHCDYISILQRCACVPDNEDDCDDQVDNDGDGYIDCDDQDCAGDPACATPCGQIDDPKYCDVGYCENDEICVPGATYCMCVPETEDDCTDQIDNDADGYTDCEDRDCTEDPACGPVLQIACADASYGSCSIGTCYSGQNMQCIEVRGGCACVPMSEIDCSNRFDDDYDGYVDCDDPDCWYSQDCIM